MAVFFITVTLLTVVEHGCEAVSQSYGVVGGVAFMNWTITDLDNDRNRFVRNPFDNASLLVFFSGEIKPYIIDKRVSYTGDVSRGIISFTLSGLTPSDAGIYKYMISTGIANSYAGSQELVIVAVGVRGGDAWMTWRINDTSNDNIRFVKSPNTATVLVYMSGSYTASVPSAYINRLTDIGNLSHGIVSYRLTNVTAADVGRYYFYPLGGVDAGGQILVLAESPSNMTIKEANTPLVNTRYTARCSAGSSIFPTNIALPMYYQWKRDGENITIDNRYTVSADGTELSIAPLQRGDHVTLTCMAWQDARAVSDNTVHVKPIYGPENMLLSPRVSLVTVLRGLDMTPVNCSAECFPGCIFQWTRSNDGYVVSRETVLKLMNVTLDDSGKYICTANNANASELKATENFTLFVLDRDEIKTQLSLVRFENDVVVFNIGYSLSISKPRSLTLQYRTVTTFNATWITEREILLLENQTVSVNVEVSVLSDQHTYSYRAYSTYEWGVSGYSSEIVIAVVTKAPGTSTASSTSSLPIALTGSTVGIFFIIILVLIIYVLRSKSKHGRKTDSESRTRMDGKVNEDYAYSSPVAEANAADLSGSQNVSHYEMLQERRHDLDQDKHYDKIQINVTTVSKDAAAAETGKL